MSRVRSVGVRIGTFVLALLFLFTAVAFSALVIYQVHQDDKKAKENAGVQAALDKAAQDKQTTNPTGAKLEGTKLTGFTPVDGVAKLQVIDTVVGTGAEATINSKITAHYTGALAKDGTIFQSSLDTGSPLSDYALSSLIKGWQEGIPGMKEGGTRRLLIPAAEAYGAQAQSGIPANSDLVFDIQLIKVTN